MQEALCTLDHRGSNGSAISRSYNSQGVMPKEETIRLDTCFSMGPILDYIPDEEQILRLQSSEWGNELFDLDYQGWTEKAPRISDAQSLQLLNPEGMVPIMPSSSGGGNSQDASVGAVPDYLKQPASSDQEQQQLYGLGAMSQVPVVACKSEPHWSHTTTTMHPVTARSSTVQAPASPLRVSAEQAALNRAYRVAKHREKRQNRSFSKMIRYASRKAYAEVRPRIKGRFATNEEMLALKAAQLEVQPEDSEGAVVPCLP